MSITIFRQDGADLVDFLFLPVDLVLSAIHLPFEHGCSLISPCKRAVLHLAQQRTVNFRQVRPPACTDPGDIALGWRRSSTKSRVQPGCLYGLSLVAKSIAHDIHDSNSARTLSYVLDSSNLLFLLTWSFRRKSYFGDGVRALSNNFDGWKKCFETAPDYVKWSTYGLLAHLRADHGSGSLIRFFSV